MITSLRLTDLGNGRIGGTLLLGAYLAGGLQITLPSGTTVLLQNATPFTIASAGPTPSAGLVRVLPIGDSNTVGVGAADAATQSEPARLKLQLDPSRFDLSSMGLNNPQLAQGGATIADMITLITTDFAGYGTTLDQSIKPGTLHIFQVMVLTNDIGKDTPSTPYIDGNGTPAYPGFRARLAQLAQLLRAAVAKQPGATCKLLLVCPPENGHNPAAPNNVWTYPKQATERDWMLANYQKAGWDRIVDLYADPLIGQYRSDNSQYWKEPLHLNALGLQRWADIMAPVISSL